MVERHRCHLSQETKQKTILTSTFDDDSLNKALAQRNVVLLDMCFAFKSIPSRSLESYLFNPFSASPGNYRLIIFFKILLILFSFLTYRTLSMTLRIKHVICRMELK